MSIVSLIVAAAENDAIGKKGQLLWNLPDDTRFFKNTTWAMPVIMGRKTFETLGKPLPGRANIVITSNPDWEAPHIIKVRDIKSGLNAAAALETKEIFIIGGGQIYKESMALADRIYITRIHAIFDDADAFFPEIDPRQWELVFKKDVQKHEKHAYDFSFETWERNNRD